MTVKSVTSFPAATETTERNDDKTVIKVNQLLSCVLDSEHRVLAVLQIVNVVKQQ